MRVAFDEQIFLMQRHGGISQSFFGLINALAQTNVTPLPPPGAVRTPGSPWGGPVLEGRVTGRLALATARRRPRKLPPHDIVHRTFYDPAWLDTGSDRPLVITIHDMIPELLPDEVPEGAHLAKRDYVDRADLILTNSACTRRDLLRVYGIPSAPVVVTPFGVAARFSRPAAPVPGLPGHYLLFVGARGGYKRFDSVVRALALLPDSLELVAVGGGPFTAEETALQHHFDVAHRVRQVGLTDEQLPGAYCGATALVIASAYEGFGLPVLEAMASGAPVITSTGGALPEVAGDAAIFVEPTPESIAEAALRLTGDSADRRMLVDTGRRRAAEFTWGRTAALTAQAYASLLT